MGIAWRILGGHSGRTIQNSIEEAKLHVRECRAWNQDKSWCNNVAEIRVPVYEQARFLWLDLGTELTGYTWEKLDA